MRAAVGVVAWLIALGFGFGPLWRYSYTPGPAAHAAAEWPSTLGRDELLPTLVVVLHPLCGCSEASLGELTRIVTLTAVPLKVLVLFDAEDDGLSIEGSSLWRTAAAIPGVTPVIDRGGVETRRFGARVSGQTFLFDSNGHLIFSGGITGARGHAGDNDGQAAVLAALRSGRAPVRTTPVFGCLLHESVTP